MVQQILGSYRMAIATKNTNHFIANKITGNKKENYPSQGADHPF